VPGPALDQCSIDLLREMQALVGEAIEMAGGTLIGRRSG